MSCKQFTLKHEIKIKKWFSAIIFLACLTFVMQRSWVCFKKYLEVPESTSTSIEYSGNLAFPAITFCPKFFKSSTGKIQPYKSEIAKNCNVNLTKYVIHDGPWVSNECQDPVTLFNELTTSLKDLNILDKIIIKTFESMKEERSIEDLDWKPIKTYPDQGKCWSLNLPTDLVKLGIQSLQFRIERGTKIDVHLHQNGLLNSELTKDILIEFKGDENVFVSVGREIKNMLDYMGQPCIENPQYFLDQCRHQQLHEETMKKVGCTTPFGYNMTNICKDPNLSVEAKRLYLDIRFNPKSWHGFQQCLFPCQLQKFQVSLSKEQVDPSHQNHSMLLFNFEKFITVSTSYHSYGFLELLAEVGGYVGLCLGYSLYHFSGLFSTIVSTILRRSAEN